MSGPFDRIQPQSTFGEFLRDMRPIIMRCELMCRNSTSPAGRSAISRPVHGILGKSVGRKFMNIKRLRAAVIAIAATSGFAGSDALHAQSYPARTVTLIVPSAAGG